MAASAGAGTQGPTPWWQLPGASGGGGAALSNLTNSAPSGYTYDPVRMGYVPTVSSAPTQEKLFNRDLSYQDQTRSATLNALQGLSGAGGGISGGGGFGGVNMHPIDINIPAGGGGGGGGPVTYQSPDASGAQANIFARAKDQVGQTTQGAISGLRNSMAGRGMAGGGLEAKGIAQVVNQGQGQLGEVTRENAIQSLDQAQKAAELNFTGGVTQRGQNINQGIAEGSQALTAQGQAIGQNESLANLGIQQQNSNTQRTAAILSALKGLTPSTPLY